MKRARWTRTTVAGGVWLTLAACSGPAPETARVEPGAAGSGWTRTPAILAVRPAADGLTFTGQAEPGARVVLRSAAGAAYAAAADAGGRFEIRVPAPQGALLLLRPETQVGQDAAESPDRLLILDGGRGPVAVLGAGRPARRLDGAPALGAIDSDGRSTIASGRAGTPDQAVTVSAGGATAQVRTDADGGWSAFVDVAPGEAVRVEGEDYVWPGPCEAAGEEPQARQAPGGWCVGWRGPGGARQSTWLPVAAVS